MLAFIFQRLSLLLPTFCGVTLIAFSLVHLIPGDPIQMRVGERDIDPARYAQLMVELGLDKPLWEQYFFYIGQVVQGNLGTSLVTREPVLHEFLTLFPATVELSMAAILFAIAIGLPLGVLAAVKRGTGFDHTIMGLSLVGYSMPIFWWALLLILLFSVKLGWLPVSGRIAVEYWVEPVTGFLLLDTLLAHDFEAFRSALRHLLLPALVLARIIHKKERSSLK